MFRDKWPEVETLTIGSLNSEHQDKHAIQVPGDSVVWVPKTMNRKDRWLVRTGQHPDYRSEAK